MTNVPLEQSSRGGMLDIQIDSTGMNEQNPIQMVISLVCHNR
jgi:hypothetical protein